MKIETKGKRIYNNKERRKKDEKGRRKKRRKKKGEKEEEEEEDQRKIVAVLFDREPMEISTDVMPLLRLSQLTDTRHFSSSSAFPSVSVSGYREGTAVRGMGFFSRVRLPNTLKIHYFISVFLKGLPVMALP